MARPINSADPGDAVDTPGSDLARHLHAYANELDYVYRTLRRYGVQAVDAEDVAQEVFLIAWRRRDDFDSSRPLRPWLGGIAFKLAHQYHQRRKQALVEQSAEEIALAEPAAPPELEPEAMDARALVMTVLARLPERHREVLVAHELDGTPVDEIASRWRVPRFTLYTRLRRARQAFADEVNRIQAAAGNRPVMARSFAPGLLLTMPREATLAPPGLRRHLLERLRAEAMLASRNIPAGGLETLVGGVRTWVLAAAAGAVLAGAGLILLPARDTQTPPRAPLSAPAAAVSPAPPVLGPPRLAALPLRRQPANEQVPAIRSGLSRDLVGFWQFEDGRGSQRAADQTSGTRACELHQLDASQAWIPGAVGGGLELGFNGWLECPQPALPRRRSAALSVALWVKRAGSPHNHRALVTRRMDQDPRNYFFFGFDGDLLTVSSSGWGGTLTAPFRAPPGKWVHVAFTHDADHLVRLFIAGREVARQRATPRVFGATAQPLRVGGGLRSQAPGQVGQLFEGAVDELLVYERALGAQEIAALAGGAAP